MEERAQQDAPPLQIKTIGDSNPRLVAPELYKLIIAARNYAQPAAVPRPTQRFAYAYHDMKRRVFYETEDRHSRGGNDYGRCRIFVQNPVSHVALVNEFSVFKVPKIPLRNRRTNWHVFDNNAFNDFQDRDVTRT